MYEPFIGSTTAWMASVVMTFVSGAGLGAGAGAAGAAGGAGAAGCAAGAGLAGAFGASAAVLLTANAARNAKATADERTTDMDPPVWSRRLVTAGTYATPSRPVPARPPLTGAGRWLADFGRSLRARG